MNAGKMIVKKVANNSSNIVETPTASKDSNSQVFRNELDIPLSFFLVGVDHHADICHLIQENGGILANEPSQAFLTITDNSSLNVKGAPICKTKYITDCIGKGQLLDFKDYKLTKKSMGKNNFTPEDDKILLNYIARLDKPHISGNKIYREVEKLHPQHTWQAWRSRYIRHLTKLPTAKPTHTKSSPPKRSNFESSPLSSSKPAVPVIRAKSHSPPPPGLVKVDELVPIPEHSRGDSRSPDAFPKRLEDEFEGLFTQRINPDDSPMSSEEDGEYEPSSQDSVELTQMEQEEAVVEIEESGEERKMKRIKVTTTAQSLARKDAALAELDKKYTLLAEKFNMDKKELSRSLIATSFNLPEAVRLARAKKGGEVEWSEAFLNKIRQATRK